MLCKSDGLFEGSTFGSEWDGVRTSALGFLSVDLFTSSIYKQTK